MDEAGIELRFDGARYGYWQQAEMRDSVDDLCASVHLAYAKPGVGSGWGLTPNTVVDVLIGGELVTTTRSDMRRRKVGPESHMLRFQGRSLGRELVDCQFSKTMSGLKLGEIVKRLCEAFKVPVKIAAETAVVPNFSMQCEVPANALINAVRAANLLLYPQPDGGLILATPSDAPPIATLVYGVDFKEYEVIDEDRLRFSDYTVKGYDYGANNALKGAAKDAGITYFRPMHVVADKHGQGLGGCERRALLERNRRLARAHRLELELAGWRYRDANGALKVWPLNRQVRVVIPEEDIDGLFLVGERALRIDDKGGYVTVLTVMHRNAFRGEEQKKQKRGSGVKGARK